MALLNAVSAVSVTLAAAIHGISIFLAVTGCIVLAGWVVEQIVKDVRRGRRRRQTR